MNIAITNYLINWSNVNYLNERNSRIYFTSGDWVRLTDAEVAELKQAIIGMGLELASTATFKGQSVE